MNVSRVSIRLLLDMYGTGSLLHTRPTAQLSRSSRSLSVRLIHGHETELLTFRPGLIDFHGQSISHHPSLFPL